MKKIKKVMSLLIVALLLIPIFSFKTLATFDFEKEVASMYKKVEEQVRPCAPYQLRHPENNVPGLEFLYRCRDLCYCVVKLLNETDETSIVLKFVNNERYPVDYVVYNSLKENPSKINVACLNFIFQRTAAHFNKKIRDLEIQHRIPEISKEIRLPKSLELNKKLPTLA